MSVIIERTECSRGVLTGDERAGTIDFIDSYVYVSNHPVAIVFAAGAVVFLCSKRLLFNFVSMSSSLAAVEGAVLSENMKAHGYLYQTNENENCIEAMVTEANLGVFFTKTC